MTEPVFIPFTVPFWRKVGLSFARAAVVTFLTLLPPAVISIVENGPTLASITALIGVVVVPTITAGIRAAQALFTTLESPQALPAPPE